MTSSAPIRLLHTAYGRIGELDVGGAEIIGYDAESGNYTSYFFDSQGHVTVDELIYDDGKWIWSGERIRTTSEFSEDGKVRAHSTSNQRTGSSGGWPWM
jgi:hypothetical protein